MSLFRQNVLTRDVGKREITALIELIDERSTREISMSAGVS